MFEFLRKLIANEPRNEPSYTRDEKIPDSGTHRKLTEDPAQQPEQRATDVPLLDDPQERKERQHAEEPRYGGMGYFGNSDSGGQSFNGAQRLNPGDPGFRAHPTREVHSPRIGMAARMPKNYVRTDERVLGDVCERLAMHPEIDVSDVTVHIEAGVIRLGGTVEDRYERRLVEEITEGVMGVRDIENGVRVRDRCQNEGFEGVSPERTLNLS
ncbi:BON domain-containing protein [Cupriavidus pampae]|uniref:BON domain-containing protein n=1 Tax=Cupriavidus pampae TaxID=659251 RepID=A0ABM8Y118_9BURK|nr:BON domain-containing protein [Cupriavidus pampae]CAG9186407.1 hypothetical protein LMG32289_06409 [Cupriavidus pampae]